MNADAASTLAHATQVWDYVCQHAMSVRPTLTLFRPGSNLILDVVPNHNLAEGRELMTIGVFPVMPSSEPVARQVYGPLFSHLGVYAAHFVTPAHRHSPGGIVERTLMSWTYHPAAALEVTWCKVIGDDGSMHDVSMHDTQVVGTDWIKAAL